MAKNSTIEWSHHTFWWPRNEDEFVTFGKSSPVATCHLDKRTWDEFPRGGISAEVPEEGTCS